MVYARRSGPLTAFLLLFVLLSASSAFSGTKRIALVVGNNQYANVNRLTKAVNDARGVGTALTEIGFDLVLTGFDIDRRTFNERVAELAEAINEGDTVVFYFAGHGVAYQGTNYLLATDFPDVRSIKKLATVETEGRSAESIIEAFQERGAGRVLLILDACRNFPFPKTLTRSSEINEGLEPPVTSDGVFVLFSAGLRQSALDSLGEDDPEPNSVFTRKLIPLLKRPGTSFASMAKTLQIEVRDLASSVQHQQNPAYYDQIPGDAFLIEVNDTAAASAKSKSESEEKEQQSHQVAAVNSDAASTNPPAKNKMSRMLRTEKMFFYLERSGGSGPDVHPGNVIWRTVSGNDPSQTVIEATLSVKSIGLGATMKMRLNTDPTFPASHVIEVAIDLPKGYVYGDVRKIARINLKETEADKGTSLIAVPARMADNVHAIALNDHEDAVKKNVELLKFRSWIDLPVSFANKRALITFYKGRSGRDAFDLAFEDWASAQTNKYKAAKSK